MQPTPPPGTRKIEVENQDRLIEAMYTAFHKWKMPGRLESGDQRSARVNRDELALDPEVRQRAQEILDSEREASGTKRNRVTRNKEDTEGDEHVQEGSEDEGGLSHISHIRRQSLSIPADTTPTQTPYESTAELRTQRHATPSIHGREGAEEHDRPQHLPYHNRISRCDLRPHALESFELARVPRVPGTFYRESDQNPRHKRAPLAPRTFLTRFTRPESRTYSRTEAPEPHGFDYVQMSVIGVDGAVKTGMVARYWKADNVVMRTGEVRSEEEVEDLRRGWRDV